MNDRAHILSEIRRTAAANSGVPLGWRRFLAETGIGYHDWCGKHWARWGDAIKEAGLKPNTLSIAYTDGVLLDALAKLTRALGHFPTADELKLRTRTETGFPSEKVFRRLGAREERVRRLSQFCKERESLDDVAAICASSSRPPRIRTAVEDVKAPSAIGAVYLLKSARYFKIGRSNAVGRRERELAIQLPEKATLVHSISTDDPIGIEAYWHRRFEDKRANGEWFSLTAQDVAAFKKRKFM